MARRPRTDIWDDLFEALRWLFSVVHPGWSLLLAAIFFLLPVLWFAYAVKNHELQFIGVWLGAIPATVSLAAGLAGWNLRKQRDAFLRQHLDIAWLNKLSWQDFERQVAEIYRHQGFCVEEVGGGGADGGVDLRLRHDLTTTVVQCKRWRTWKIGVRPVRELFGIMTAEMADRAIFITSGVYTEAALQFAKGKQIELIDGAQMAKMLRSFQNAQRESLVPSTTAKAGCPTAPTTPSRPRCPRCGSEMILRRARTGPHAGKEFWGCSMFGKTKCGGIRQVE